MVELAWASATLGTWHEVGGALCLGALKSQSTCWLNLEIKLLCSLPSLAITDRASENVNIPCYQSYHLTFVDGTNLRKISSISLLETSETD